MPITSPMHWVEDHPAPEPIPADDPRGLLAVLVTILAQLAERCRIVLPDLDVSRSLPYVLALHWHAWQADSESYAALLAAEPFDDRLSADDAMHAGTIHQVPAPYSWLEPDTAQSRVPERASHKRADGTVRGRDMVYVVGADGDGIYQRMTAGECLARAHMWNAATGHTVPDLIGTDTTAWAQVVNYSPDQVTTVHGATFAQRPDRDPHDISVGDARKRVPYRSRTAQYHPRPDLEYLPWSVFLATGQRVVKHYRTRFMVTRDERREWIGHRPARRTVIVRRDKTATGRTIARPVDVAADQLKASLESAFTVLELPNRYRITRADGTTCTITVDRKNRRYCLNVKHADGTTARRNARTIDAALRNAETL